ncbi:MAG: alpha/beta hydrolase [Proteobacteria bacterium]|nr:alpha/beta hydrolase [Pseudomonadota bacterium]
MDFPTPRMIDTNGIELEVYQAGEGGIPVVLCHGWPEHAYSWRYQIPVLVAAGYHCIVPNQRGYGASSKPDDVEAYDIHHLTNDHNGLLDALGIEKAIYIGHDWGAIVVWNHALLNPDRVLGVANLSVPFRVREPADPVAFWEKMLGQDFYIVHFNRQPGVAAAAFEKNPRLFLRNMYRTRHWLEPAGDSEPAGASIIRYAEVESNRGELLMSEEELDVFVTAFEKGGFKAPCNWYRNFTRNWETTENVEQKITCPSLMIYGQYDMVPQSDMTPFVADLETHTLECGHWIQQEEPEKTNEILLEWLQRKMKNPEPS